jgi:drug/metabolite transporter (DMT)-like permease
LASDKTALPALLAFIAAAFWGVWWIPIRYLESLGLDGAWGSVVMNGGAGLTALAWLMLRRLPFDVSRRAALGAVLVAMAVTTYSVAITMTEVVRVILLFYLAPAWSKIIEWAYLNHRWRWTATVSICTSLVGAYFVLGGELSLASIGPGDVLGLLSGMFWAAGSTFLFTGPRVNPIALCCVTGFAGAVIGLGFITVSTGGIAGLAGDALASDQNVAGAFALGGLAGIFYVLPILFMTLWSAQRLSPGVMSFLLTAEILSGVISGALLLDEPFSEMQAAGAVLILAAAAVEVVPAVLKRSA